MKSSNPQRESGNKAKIIRVNLLKIILQVLIGALLVAAILYLLLEFVIKPRMRVQDVEISYTGVNVPLSEQLSEIAERLKGAAFTEAEPKALETAFTELEEILNAEVTRSWRGEVTITLNPRLPLCILRDRNTVTGEITDVPADEEGVLFTASKKYLEYFAQRSFIIEIPEIDALQGQLTGTLLKNARMLNELKELDRETSSLITMVKYDNNSNQKHTAIFLEILDREVELQVASEVDLKPLHALLQGIGSVIGSSKEENSFTTVAVFKDSAVFRL